MDHGEVTMSTFRAPASVARPTLADSWAAREAATVGGGVDVRSGVGWRAQEEQPVPVQPVPVQQLPVQPEAEADADVAEEAAAVAPLSTRSSEASSYALSLASGKPSWW